MAPPLRCRIRTKCGINAQIRTAQGRRKQVNQVTQHDREQQLEDTGSRVDNESVIHEFAAETGFQVDFDKQNT